MPKRTYEPYLRWECNNWWCGQIGEIHHPITATEADILELVKVAHREASPLCGLIIGTARIQMAQESMTLEVE